jgi:hypothetical protein
MENDPYEIAEPGPLPSPLEFLQAVYSNEGLPLSARLKAAIEAAQYVHPKLAVTATIESGDFAVRLDQAIERSRRVSMIEAKPMTDVSTENVSSEASGTKTLANGKPMIPDRRYRRW